MSEIELVIKIPEEAKQAFDCAESNDLKGCYYDHGGIIGDAIKNGTPLPKGHGRLIDEEMVSLSGIHFETERDHAMMIGRLNSAQTIIEADKE